MKVEIKNNKIKVPLLGEDRWLVATPEERVRQNFINHLVNHYGYSLDQMAQELKVSNSKRGQGNARADIVIWRNAQDKKEKKGAFIVIECKAENVKIQKVDYFQGLNYATWAKAKFFVTTNDKETKFFKVLNDVIPDEIDEIVDLPKAKDIFNEKEINRILQQTKAFTRDEFQNLLFSCHNVIRNNDKLSPEMAFDEISKILFMKIRYERMSAKDATIFSKEEFLKLKENDKKVRGDENPPFYQYFFEQTKRHFAKDEIFEKTDSIRIRESSFLEIVKLLEKYNLSDTSDDVKGIAFEEFLGKTFRGDLGQFFTPRTIVNFMTFILDPKEHETVCDPCCGTGGFLISSFEYVRSKIEKDIQEQKEKIKAELMGNKFDELSEEKQNNILEKINWTFSRINKDIEIGNGKSRLYDLSFRRIFGTDAEPRSARTAKMNMIMHGDGHGGVHHHDGLLNINGIFENRFDVILTNPPFGARISRDYTITDADKFKDEKKIKNYTERFGEEYIRATKQISDNIGKNLIDIYDLGKQSNLTEVLFMERCLRLLKPGGRMGIVLPEGVLNNSQLQGVREYFEGRAKIILIVSIPQDVFNKAGATVKPSLLFLKKFNFEEKQEYQQVVLLVTNIVNEKYQPMVDEANKPLKDLYILLKQNEVKILTLKRKSKNKNSEEKFITKSLKELADVTNNLKAKISFLKKDLKIKLDVIQVKKEIEIKQGIKERFKYFIPVAQVEKAGITSTGAKTDNELDAVLSEFRNYRDKSPLWQVDDTPVLYSLEDDKVFRIMLGEREEMYG
jgi:type I restriction enzyme M protein